MNYQRSFELSHLRTDLSEDELKELKLAQLVFKWEAEFRPENKGFCMSSKSVEKAKKIVERCFV